MSSVERTYRTFVHDSTGPVGASFDGDVATRATVTRRGDADGRNEGVGQWESVASIRIASITALNPVASAWCGCARCKGQKKGGEEEGWKKHLGPRLR